MVLLLQLFRRRRRLAKAFLLVVALGASLGTFWKEGFLVGETKSLPRELKRNTTMAQTSKPTAAPPTHNLRSFDSPKLWIHVEGYAEGMAAWRESITELYGVAKTIGHAVLVEPCVRSGVLNPCTGSNRETRFTQVLDTPPSLLTTPHMASYQEFLQATNYTDTFVPSARICLGTYKPGGCTGFYGLDDDRNTETKPMLDQAIQQAKLQSERSQGQHTVLKVQGMIRKSLVRWKPQDPHLAQAYHAKQQSDQQALLQRLRFPTQEFERVRRFLEDSFNIKKGEPFGAIQWRPEGPLCRGGPTARFGREVGLDYLSCAKSIIQARRILAKRDNIPLNNFFLVSPLSLKTQLQWGGVKLLANVHSNTSYPSLQLLLDNGFHKLEQAHNLSDGTFLAVWDFILAMTATSFSTCGKHHCEGHKEVCAHCNHCGQSSLYITALREEYQQQHNSNHKNSTDYCWPF